MCFEATVCRAVVGGGLAPPLTISAESEGELPLTQPVSLQHWAAGCVCCLTHHFRGNPLPLQTWQPPWWQQSQITGIVEHDAAPILRRAVASESETEPSAVDGSADGQLSVLHRHHSLWVSCRYQNTSINGRAPDFFKSVSDSIWEIKLQYKKRNPGLF